MIVWRADNHLSSIECSFGAQLTCAAARKPGVAVVVIRSVRTFKVEGACVNGRNQQRQWKQSWNE
eukprot:368712-Amphidinium_carterae.1